ncbi:MAG: copper homeostasis protein CutC [Bacteroidota bacterium]
MLVEVCANSLQSALNAEAAGADRIELCAELGVGGITPSHGLIKSVKERVKIPVHVLLRPRSGHFTYTEAEFEVLLQDLELCKSMKVEGIVSGVLNADFSLDVERTQQLVEAASPMHFTFHRAFDWVKSPMQTLRQLETIGIDTLLTSGQETTAELGLELLQQLHNATTKTMVMAGGGIHVQNVGQFKKIGLHALHLSGTSFANALVLEGKISMNAKQHLRENEIAVTNEAMIRQIVEKV